MSAVLKELPACPVETTLTLISDKWKVLIIRDLLPGTKRFPCNLKMNVAGISIPQRRTLPSLCTAPAPSFHQIQHAEAEALPFFQCYL